MIIDRYAAADEISAALETGRRELARVDLEKVRDDAVSAARSALPRRQQRRRRWPLLAAVLGLAGAAMGWLLLPEVRSRLTRLVADRRRSLAFPAVDAEVAPTLDAEMGPETRSYLQEMAASPA